MCSLLSPVLIGFFYFIFVAAVNGTNEAIQGRWYVPLSSLYYIDVYGSYTLAKFLAETMAQLRHPTCIAYLG